MSLDSIRLGLRPLILIVLLPAIYKLRVAPHNLDSVVVWHVNHHLLNIYIKTSIVR